VIKVVFYNLDFTP